MSNLYYCIVRYNLYYCHDGCTACPIYTAVLYGTIHTTVTMVARYNKSILLNCTVRLTRISSNLYRCIVRYDLYYCHDGYMVRLIYTVVWYGTIYTSVSMVARYNKSILLNHTVRLILLSRWWHHGTSNLYCFIVRLRFILLSRYDCTVRSIWTAVLYGTIYTTVTMVTRYVQSILLYCTVRFILFSRW